MNVNLYIRELRPKNWLKNVFVFIPITFALELTNWGKLLTTSIVFAAFCLVSSAVYIFNDIVDAHNDAAHPEKCKRPIASGALQKKNAAAFAVVILVAGFVLAFYGATMAAVFIGVYVAINGAYALVLKHHPIFDCFCIAMGFVLRVLAGGAAIINGYSDWLFLTVVAMSLFMAFGKRRGEIISINGSGKTRVVLEYYNVAFLNGMMFVCAGLAIMFYSLWAMWRGCNMMYTVPLLIFIVCKYLLLVHSDDICGDPTTVIFGNRTLIVACGLYALLTVGLLYVGGP